MYLQAGAPTSIVELGMAYNTNPTVKALVDSFGDSKESSDLYPGDNKTFVTAIYQNLFGRLPDAPGLAYWSGTMDQKIVTRANGVLSIMSGAQATDISTINNKRDVASAFTATLVSQAQASGYSGLDANVVVRALLAKVNAATSPASFSAMIASTVQTLAAAPRTGTVFPVIQGAYYQTGSASGYLDRSGEFTYAPGEQLSLSIGGVELANVPAGAAVTPLALDDPSASLNLARVMRALDKGAASTAQVVTVTQLPTTTLFNADVTTEASSVAALAKIDAAAVLPATTDSKVVAVVTAAKAQAVAVAGTGGSTYQYFESTLGLGYNSFLGNGKPQSCPTTIARVTAASVTLAALPNWTSGTMSGTGSFTFSDASTANISFTSTSGTFQRAGKTFNYAFRQNYTSGARLLALTLTNQSMADDAFGCAREDLLLRDKRPNSAPTAAFKVEVAIGQTPGAWDTYRFQSGFAGVGASLSDGSVSTDRDGRIASLTWTSSKGNRTRTDTPARYGDNRSDFTEQVYPGERVTITLTAVDDEGASSTKILVIHPNAPTLEEIIKLLSGKLYVTTDSPYQYFYRLNPGNTTITEWEVIGFTTKVCNASAFAVSDLASSLILSRIVFNGGDFRYTDTDGYSYEFKQASALPQECNAVPVKPAPVIPPPSTPVPPTPPNPATCPFTDAAGACTNPVIGYIGADSHPPKSGNGDLCANWQVIPYNVQLATCSYADGGSGYTLIQNHSNTAEVCWTTTFNNGETPSKGCYSNMPNGMISKSSCFNCGYKNGGAKMIVLTRFRTQ